MRAVLPAGLHIYACKLHILAKPHMQHTASQHPPLGRDRFRFLGVSRCSPRVVKGARAQRVLAGQRQRVDPVPVTLEGAHQLAVSSVPRADAAGAAGFCYFIGVVTLLLHI